MFKAIKEFFTGKPIVNPAADPMWASAPYKVPEPAATTPIPFVVESPAVETVTEIKVEAVEPAKKPRKPRAPKAVAAIEPAAKKSAPKSKKV